jgi:mannose-6-phosphate isomerase-like protein (cupin superfamily)
MQLFESKRICHVVRIVPSPFQCARDSATAGRQPTCYDDEHTPELQGCWLSNSADHNSDEAAMNQEMFLTKALGSKPDAKAPDGSEVRLLLQMTRGSMAHFTLNPREVSRAVAHKSIEEIWYFVRGKGRMWRLLRDSAQVVEVYPGVSITIPTGAKFQFRNDGDEPLEAIGVTMPPWPGADEAFQVEGLWEATVES